MKKSYPSYEEAKKIVMDNGVKTMVEYKAIYKKLGLPTYPDYSYKNKGWENWPNFLGRGKKVYPSYEEAKKIAMKNGVRTQTDYMNIYSVLGLPSNPSYTYKNEGWTNWFEFLGREKKVYPSYEEAKKIVNKKCILNRVQYYSVCKNNCLPSTPDRYYLDKGWTNWTEFFGGEKKVYPSYEEALRIVQNEGLQNMKDYRKQCKELGLPTNPATFYKNNGWTDYYSFWGQKSRPSYPSYEKAKEIVLENGIQSMEGYKTQYKVLGLPPHPHRTYKDNGWIDSYDFFGTPKPISSSARKTKVYTTLSISPVLLEDNAPLQIVYMLASQIDKKLASEIEELLNTASCEDRLNMVKEQLKNLKADAETVSVSPSEGAIGELSAMESVMDVFEDTLGSLPEDTTEYLNNIIKNYYHNATNRALIAEYDD